MDLKIIYESYKILTKKYYDEFKEKHNLEYNQMVKKEIDIDIMGNVLTRHFENMKDYNPDSYNKLQAIFQKIKGNDH